MAKRVCECLLLKANFSAISWQEQVNYQCKNDAVHFELDQHAQFDFYSASSLKQHSAGRHVVPLGYIILIPSKPVVVLTPEYYVFSLTEKQHIPILLSGLTQSQL